MEQNLFSSLPVDAAILQAVEQMGFQQMTEVQNKRNPADAGGTGRHCKGAHRHR